jgi:hypothetical protein
MNERLQAAYRATSYVVFGAEGRFAIRIGEKSPPLDDLLVQHGTRSWAFITAYNPSSALLAPTENQRRQAELERALSEAGYPYCEGEGVADDGAWPAEPSLLVLGIAEEDAVALGRHFGQRAIVVAEVGTAARLLWL